MDILMYLYHNIAGLFQEQFGLLNCQYHKTKFKANNDQQNILITIRLSPARATIFARNIKLNQSRQDQYIAVALALFLHSFKLSPRFMLAIVFSITSCWTKFLANIYGIIQICEQLKLIYHNQKMIRNICHKAFKMSFSQNILVLDPSPFDMLVNDIPQDGLQTTVSGLLQIPYLSKYTGKKEELEKTLIYKGGIIGYHTRHFFSIPTAKIDSEEFYYVHYLLDTGCSYTTLTHQALCCLFQKKTNDHSVRFPEIQKIQIGGVIVEAHLSNPNPPKNNPTHNYPNANLLGMSFLRKFSGYKLTGDFDNFNATLELIN